MGVEQTSIEVGRMIKTVKAKKVREGDFLPGLDNAYVPWAPEDVDGYSVRILMHDADGEELTLECHRDMPVTVERKS